MGCASSVQVYPEPVYCSFVQLEDLPVEILHKIFDELDIRHIYQSIYCTSKFFRRVVTLYDRFHFNMKLMSHQCLKYITSQIQPEQITQMTLVNDENTPLLLGLFLEKFSLNAFVRLRSLTLIDIDDDEMITRILIPIAEADSRLHLSSIQITNENESYDDIFIESMKMILSKECLRTFHVDLSYGRGTSNALSWPENCAIRHFIFRGACSIAFLRTIFHHSEYLQMIRVADFDFDDEVDLNQETPAFGNDDDSDDENEPVSDESSTSDEDSENGEEVVGNAAGAGEANLVEQADEMPSPDAILAPPAPPLLAAAAPAVHPNPTPRRERFEPIQPGNNLTSLTIDSCTITMSKIEWLLKEFPNLKQFRLTTSREYDDETILDASLWSKLLIQLDKFEFIFNLLMEDNSTFNADECIEKFRTPFWTEEKRWFVALEKYPRDIMLYTLPYMNNLYVVKKRSSNFEFHTNLSNPLSLGKSSMDNVRDLYFDVSELSDESLNDNLNLPYFARVHQVFLYGQSSRSRPFFNHLSKLVDLSTVEELYQENPVPTVEFDRLLRHMPKLQSIRTTSTVLDHLNAARFSFTRCLRSLTVYPAEEDRQMYVNIEPFCTMFPRIQYLSIPISDPDSGEYVLDELKNDLVKVTFRYPSTDNSYDDSDNTDEQAPETFSSWIEQLSKKYHCAKKASHIHIWLK